MSLEQDLIKRLENSPETVILGVVGAGGVAGTGAGASGDNVQWTLQIRLVLDGAVCRDRAAGALLCGFSADRVLGAFSTLERY